MESLIFAFEAVSPIVALVCLGYFLKIIGLMPKNVVPIANRLVFRVFLPVMLFLNVYNISADMEIGFDYIIYAVCAVLVVYIIGNVTVVFITKGKRRAPLLQTIFRSNFALIGLPLADMLAGEEGIAISALLAAVVVPLFNVLAILCFSIHSDGKKPSIKKVILDIFKNPLIIGVVSGLLLLLVKNNLPGFDITAVKPIDKILTYLSNMATPLALIALGTQFEFSAIKGYRRELIAGVLSRCFIVPTLAIGAAYLFFDFTAMHFAAFVALFASPVAVSSAPMAQELGGDSVLAGQLVVWTTLVSGFGIFLFSFLLRLLGVFA